MDYYRKIDELSDREIEKLEFQTPCQVMRAIRKEIARQNGFFYNPPECPHSKKCQQATCAACEKEAAELEEKLENLERNDLPVHRNLSKEFLKKLAKFSARKPKLKRTYIKKKDLHRLMGKVPARRIPYSCEYYLFGEK